MGGGGKRKQWTKGSVSGPLAGEKSMASIVHCHISEAVYERERETHYTMHNTPGQFRAVPGHCVTCQMSLVKLLVWSGGGGGGGGWGSWSVKKVKSCQQRC